MGLTVTCRHCGAILDGLAEYDAHARALHDPAPAHRVQLRPRGAPDPGARWADPRPRWVEIDAETPDAWVGRPLDNPVCPALTWPRFAWEAVREVGR